MDRERPAVQTGAVIAAAVAVEDTTVGLPETSEALAAVISVVVAL